MKLFQFYNSLKDFPAKKHLFWIAVSGIALDFYQTFSLWWKLRSPQQFMETNIKMASKLMGWDKQFGGVDFLSLLSNSIYLSEEGQKAIFIIIAVVTVLLLGVIVWDVWVYRAMVQFKNWARIYVMSVAAFYLLSNVFNFSIVNFLFGSISLFLLYRYRALFKRKQNMRG